METKNTKRVMIYTDDEIQIIKNIFAENDELLRAIRKTMLQMPLNAVDLACMSGLKPEVLKVLRKAFLPVLDGDAPLHQIIDLWMTIQIVDKTPELAEPHLLAREKVIKYLDQQLAYIEQKKKPRTKLYKMAEMKAKTPLQKFVDLIARNTIISHIEQQLNVLMILGGIKGETIEQMRERLEKDSAK